MRYLLDTNAVIGLLANKASLHTRVRRHAPEHFGISAVTTYELYFGAFKGRRTAYSLGHIEASQFEIVGFDQDDSRQAGAIRAMLAATGTPIGLYDVLIAGQAQSCDLTLITHDTGEFSRVEGLRIEDWES